MSSSDLQDLMRDKVNAMRDRIRKPVTPYRVAMDSDIKPTMLYRFLNGKELAPTSAEKLRRYLGIEWKLTERFRKM